MVEWWENLLPDAACTQQLAAGFTQIIVRTKQTTWKNTGGGANRSRNSKFIKYMTLFNCKYLYWLPVGLFLCVHE